MYRFLGLVAAALVLALPAGAVGPRVKNTKGWIESLAMDGPRVAYAVEGGSGCTKVFVWNVRTEGGAVVSGPKTCDADSTSTGAGVREIAVAGARVAWIVNQGGNSESDDYLYTATLGGQKERLVATAFRSGDVDGTLKGAWMNHLVGAGDRIAVNRFTTDASGTITQASLQRLDTGLTTLVLGKPSLYAASLDLGRVAVLRPDQKVAIYDAATKQLLLTIAPTSAKEVALRKDYAVVLTRTKTVEVYDSHIGTPAEEMAGCRRCVAAGRPLGDRGLCRRQDGVRPPAGRRPRRANRHSAARDRRAGNRGARDRLRLRHGERRERRR